MSNDDNFPPDFSDQPFFKALWPFVDPAVFFAFRILHDWQLAEDVVQDAVLKACYARTKFDPERSLRNWFITIVRNTAITMKVRMMRQRHLGVCDQEVQDESISFEEYEALSRDLVDCYDRLTDEQRDIIEKLYFDPDPTTHRDVGTQRGTTRAAVTQMKNRALVSLANCLDEKGRTAK